MTELIGVVMLAFNLSPGSPAIDAGEVIPGFHCPAPTPYGQAIKNEGCQEWKGAAPDIGACEFDPLGGDPGFPCNQEPWFRPEWVAPEAPSLVVREV